MNIHPLLMNGASNNMKIGLICRGRTRSTAILDSLCYKYNLKNKNELYFDVNEIILTHKELRKKISNEELLPLFKSKIKNITNDLFTENNFGCKLWPSMLALPANEHNIYNESLDDIKQTILFDLEYYFNLSQYDQLYFLNRNVEISTISWVYSKRTDLYHTYKGRKNKYYPITLNYEDFAKARFYILECCLQEKIKTYLVSNKIPFIEISDQDYNLYSNNAKVLEETDIDYHRYITNINQFKKFIGNTFDEYSEKTKYWTYN
jgi:hypothetical protein